jgi:hypothetical protein
MQLFAQISIVVLVVFFTSWSIRSMVQLRAVDEAADEPFAENPFAEVAAPLKSNPKERTGAIAMQEPDDNDITDAFPPSKL